MSRLFVPCLVLLLLAPVGCRGVSQEQMAAQPPRTWQIEYYQISAG